MKLLTPLAVASATVALIIPDQRIAQFFSENELPAVRSYRATEVLRNIEWVIGRAAHRTGSTEAGLPKDDYSTVKHISDTPASTRSRDSSILGKLGLVDTDNDEPSLTLYQMINRSEHSTVFAKFLSKFDDIVEELNNTDSKYTVFVPTDKAFEKFSHVPDLPQKCLRTFIEYHISPELFPVSKVFSSRTVPTALDERELGPYPQRISTQLGLHGLTLNYLSHIKKSNIEATNGIIHALDHVLIPPFLASDTLNFLSAYFSTFELGLMKTGLFDVINDTSTHTGSTIFAPTNKAFKKLGPSVTGFLFSRWGEKYLKALLKYHVVFDHTLYSDAYNKPKGGRSPQGTTHIDLPTLLEDHQLSIDIAHLNRFFTIKINGFTSVVAPDVIVRDGAIQVINDVLIPPRKPGHYRHAQQLNSQDVTHAKHNFFEKADDNVELLTIDELIMRLEPFTE